MDSNMCACVLGVCVGYVFQRPTIPSSCPASFADLMRRCWIAEPKVRSGTEPTFSSYDDRAHWNPINCLHLVIQQKFLFKETCKRSCSFKWSLSENKSWTSSHWAWINTLQESFCIVLWRIREFIIHNQNKCERFMCKLCHLFLLTSVWPQISYIFNGDWVCVCRRFMT